MTPHLTHLEKFQMTGHNICFYAELTLLHSEWPKLYGVLAVLSAIGFTKIIPNYHQIFPLISRALYFLKCLLTETEL